MIGQRRARVILHRITRKLRLSSCLLGTLLLASASAAPGEATSAWVSGRHSAARLIEAGVAPPDNSAPAGRLLAGIEIRLDAKFLTYWRNPGEAGVAPVFGFAGSDNLAQAEVAFPAPRRFDEDGIDAYGYREDVVFPVFVTPGDPARPVTLDLILDYAVCANICLPAKAHLVLVLRARTGQPGTGAAATIVTDALAEVPQPRHLGEAGAVGIDALTLTGPATAEVTARTPDGTATLFVEPPDGYFVKTAPGVKDASGHLRFGLQMVEFPPGASRPADPLRLTLVSPAGAIEVLARWEAPARLDAPPAKP